MKEHELFMKRALDLARLGAGVVSPNPMVGCVIVYNGKIIGEGFHKKYGDWHAEVNAVDSVLDKSILSESEVYVTLEPCSHFGKTPPCADLLVKHHIKKVIVCNLDPNPLVAGKGIQKLIDAGIEVETGILETEGRALNKRFFTFFEQKRPYITLKWAESSDGFIAKPNYETVQISNTLSRRFVHKMRVENDAIMVGTNTIRHDNPQLNTRFWTGKSPIRVLIDRELSLNTESKIFDGLQPTICYNSIKNEENGATVFVKKTGLTEIVEDLFLRKIQSIIIEGGTKLIESFLAANLWDEAIILRSQSPLNEGIISPKISSFGYQKNIEKLGDNEVMRFVKMIKTQLRKL
jgi:diaminohydroxyphosphoribosylaminopyrimidine deaminase / 5-amino-6-(5-phosphoribosylamino)uracil reductase